MYEHVIGACRVRPVTDLLDVREPFLLKSVGRPPRTGATTASAFHATDATTLHVSLADEGRPQHK